MNPMRRRALGLVPLSMALPLVGCSSRGATLADLGDLPANAGQLRWRYRLDDAGTGFRPALHGSTVWACDQDGRIQSLDAASGERIQRFSAGRALISGVAARENLVVVIDAEGLMRAFDAAGAARWQAALSAEPLSLPALAGRVVLVRLSNGTVVAHDPETGVRRWLYTFSDAALVLRQSAMIATDAVNAYVGLSNGQLAALSLSTGASLWETRVSVPRGANEIERIADVVGAPVVDGAVVCAAAYQGRMTCVNANNGQAIWSHDMRAASGIAMSDAGMLVVIDIEGRMTAFSSRRDQLWQQQALQGRRPSAPVFVGGTVWVGDGGGVAHALDAADGRVIARVAIDRSPIVSPPVPLPLADASLALFQTSGGTLAAVGLQ